MQAREQAIGDPKPHDDDDETDSNRDPADLEDSEWERAPVLVDLPPHELTRRLRALGAIPLPIRVLLGGGEYAEGFDWKTPDGWDPDDFNRTLDDPEFWAKRERRTSGK